MNLGDVTPDQLRRELRRLGYVEFDSTGRSGATWVDPDAVESVSVVVPREDDRDVRGFRETIQSAVERLAWIAEQSPEAMLLRLAGGEDRLELRILHSITEDHGVPILKASSVMDGFVRVIKSGARTRFSGARADHRGTAGPDYDQALAAIRVMAPAQGSFRLIAVASESEQTSMVHDMSEGKARETLASTMTSLQTLSQENRAAGALDDSDVERLVDGGVSRQLLKAIERLAFTSTSGLQLEFSASWDERQGSPSAVPVEPVVIGDAQVVLAAGLDRRLAELEPTANYHLTGWAELARADDRSLAGFPAGTVVVRSRHENRRRDVLVELGADLFHEVKPGVSDIEMVGTLERVSGRWHLLAPRNIRVSTPVSTADTPPSELRLGEEPGPK